MKKIISLALSFPALCLYFWAEPQFSVDGYYKNFFIFFHPPAIRCIDTTPREPDLGAVNSRLRVKLTIHALGRLSFFLDYDLSARIQDRRLFQEYVFLGSLKPVEYRWTDFRNRIYPGPDDPVSSFGLFHNLDRFCLAVKTDVADILVGRQAIAWGSARVINPTDIIVPFAFNELDREERRGVDAVRLRVPLGMMDELDAGFVAGEDFAPDKNAFFLRGKIYKWKTDISALLLSFRKHLLLGVDLARAVGGAGFWLEMAYVIPDYFRKIKTQGENNYVRASFGLDYNLATHTYGFVEYHFNSAGEKKPEQYTRLFDQSAYQDGTVYLMGRHYLNIGGTYQLTPLLPLTGLLILNLSDMSLVFSPLVEYSIAQNIYLSAGAYIGIGKNPETLSDSKGLSLLTLKSEFGTYPHMVFTSFRVYF